SGDPDPDDEGGAYDPAVPSDPDDPAARSPGGAVAKKESFGEIFIKLLPYLTSGVLLLALAAVVVLFIRSVGKAEEKAFRGFRKKPTDRAVAEMYRLVILLLGREGVSPATETPDDFAVRADGSAAMKGLNVFLADVMPVFMKCEFGDPSISPVTEEERRAVLKLTTALYRRVVGNKNPILAFFIKISLFL
ncbi:MAG: hypothetical protein NC237_08620, partial [Eubacterium sp.]|nr:hypothetical protein [Eubacterium sp.]